MRIDVLKNGKLWLAGQLVTNPNMRSRVWDALARGDRLELIPKVGPPPPPPASGFVPIMLTAEAPLEGLARGSWRGRVGLSADHKFRQAVIAAVPVLRSVGARLYAWGDCSATPASDIMAMMRELHLDGWCGQAESDAQAFAALALDCPEMTGDAASLTAGMRNRITELVNEGALLFHQNAYWGDSQGRPSQVSAQGVPARLNAGVYPGCHPAAEYVADMPALALPHGPLGAIFKAEGGDWTPFEAAAA